MLDSLTRWDLQEVLMDVWSREQLTAMVITHDGTEAILLGDRVVMMTNGPRARVERSWRSTCRARVRAKCCSSIRTTIACARNC